MYRVLVSLALFHFLGLEAGAWPFAHRTTGIWSITAQHEVHFFQADTDPFLEVYSGGNHVMHPVPGGSGSLTGLPEFDYDPYAPNFPVTFVNGRGVVGDIDGDGDIDLVRSALVAYNGVAEDNFRIMACHNNGAGQFSRGWHLKRVGDLAGMWRRAPHLALADLDRDGDLDLIDNFPGVRVHWNPGNGDFGASIATLNSSFTHLDALAVADFDGNGWLDIAAFVQLDLNSDPDIYHWTGRLIVLSNDGGTFAASTIHTLPTHVNYTGAQAADLDGDGRPDLLAGVEEYDGTRTLYWHRSTGSGFAAPAYLAATSPFDTPFLVRDINEDGIADIVFADREHSIKWLRGTGGGNYAAAATVRTENASTVPQCIGIGDLDRDGDDDIVTDSGYTFLENRTPRRSPALALASSDASAIANLSGVTRLAVADFNGDRRDDLIAVTPSQKKLWLAYGEADGTPSTPIFKNTQNDNPHGVATADFDRDGRMDLAYTLPTTGQVRQALNNGASIFAWTDTSIASIPGVALIAAGELGTPNGRADLLTASGTTGQVRWLYPSGNSWLGQNVLNSWNPAPGSIMAVNATSRPGDEAFGLAGDDSTLFVRGYQLNPTWVAVGTHLATPVSTSPVGKVMTWADATGDGRSEAVFVLGNGSLGYWDPISAGGGTIGSAGAVIRDLAPVDWNRDGRTDFLCATNRGISLFHHNDGSWRRTDLLADDSGFDSVAAIDLDRSGLIDAAAAKTAAGQVHYLRNDSRVMEASTSASAITPIVSGQGGTAFSIIVRHPGRPAQGTRLADVEVAPVRSRLLFRRAVNSNGTWAPGTALTKSELQECVASASLLADSTVIGSSGPAALDASGQLNVSYVPALGNLVPLQGGQIRTLTIRINLTPAAESASIRRFFVSQAGLSARILDDLSPDSPVLESKTASTLVTIESAFTPLQQWRIANFGTPDGIGTAANDADPDGDDVANIIEYVTSRDPTAGPWASIGNSLPIELVSQGDNDHLLADVRLLDTYDDKIRLTIQQTTNLKSWTTLSTRTGTGPWTGAQPTTTALRGGRTRFRFDTGAVPSIKPNYALRLMVEELP